MADVTGTLRDFGLNFMYWKSAELVFTPSKNATWGGTIYSTDPIIVHPSMDGTFSAALQATDVLDQDDVFYTIKIRWLGGADVGYTVMDFPDWKLYVASSGGAIGELIKGYSQNPYNIIFMASQPEPWPVGSVWVNSNSGEILRRKASSMGVETEYLGNIRGPRGVEGPQGIPGVLAVSNDAAVATYASTPGTDTRTTLDELYTGSPVVASTGVAPAASGRYDPFTNVFNLQASHFRRTRALVGKAEAGNGVIKIQCIGDSNTLGLGVHLDGGLPSVSGYPNQVAVALRDRGFNVASDGLIYPGTGLDSRWVWNGIGSTGITNALLASFDDGAGGTFTPFTTCDRFEVVYLNQYAGGMTFQIDDGPTYTVGRTATGGYDTWVSPTVTPGMHTLTVTALPTMHIVSVEATNTAGIRIAKAGISGTKMTDWAADSTYAYKTIAGLWSPNLAVVMLGTNDAGDSVEGFRTATTALVADLRSRGTEILVVGPPPRLESELTAYYEVLYERATALNFPLLDLRDRVGSYAEAKNFGYFSTYPGDPTHVSANGLTDIARAVIAAIGL